MSQLIWSKDSDNVYDMSNYDTDQLPTHQITYQVKVLLWGPLQILFDYSELILTVLISRMVIVSISKSPLREKRVLIQTSKIIFGVYQIMRYLNRSCPDLPFNSSCGLIYTTAISFTFFITVVSKFTTNQKAQLASTYLVGFAPLLYNEYRIRLSYNQQYCFLRSIFMALAMKLISLVYLNHHSKRQVSVFAYLTDPASTILGVWHPYEQKKLHARSNKEHKWFRTTLKWVRRFMILILILFASANMYEIVDCVDNTLMLNGQTKFIITIYLTALEFRLSHYFSCHLAGFLLDIFAGSDNDNQQLCDIMRVEFPRSLVDVVTAWNKPMHYWLKKYVFQLFRRQYNVPVAIAATYTLSSMLHGIKFHIWSVLMTLGVLTWLEHNIRLKLAKKLDACIKAQPCQHEHDLKTGQRKCADAHSRNEGNSHLVCVINTLFRVYAMIQLAYLGYIFVGNTDEASYTDAIQRWSSLYFFGHCLGILTFLTLKLF